MLERWRKYQFRQVTDEQIETAERQLAERRAEVAELSAGLAVAALRLRYATLRLAQAFQLFLGVEDRHIWWAVSLFLGLFATLLTFLVLLAARPTVGASALILALAFGTATFAGILILFPVSNAGLGSTLERMRADRQRRRDRVRDLNHGIDELAHWISEAKIVRAIQQHYRQAVEYQQSLEHLLASERYQLQVMDWRSLRGIPFEEFLARVFRMLGYDVETTKASGDQGVDLIVSKKGHRVAIQSKGYGESVGNKAVQEAFAGMAYYRCSECVVITNSQFTSGAIDLANRVGCRLIDGAEIPALIAGRIYSDK